MSQKATTEAINGLQSDIDVKSEDFYGECNISPSTVAKTVTTLNGGFVLKKGAKISVKFLQGHTASTMTLNVDGTGAKNVYRNGSSPKSDMVKAYNVYDFVYDGTYWRIVGVDTDTTYSLATTSSQGLMSSADKIKVDSIGNVNLLQTENKTSIVLAINEINAKTIKNNNSIPPFSGFMTDEDRLNIKDENYEGGSFSLDFHAGFASYNPLSVYYNEVNNHFYYKAEGFFYYNWDFSYLYNTDDELSIGRDDVFFSYNNQHYIMWGGVLKDISIIQSKSIINDNTIKPFYGYLPSGATVIDISTTSTNGDVLYDSANNRFVFRDKSDTIIKYYANWTDAYLYNDNYGTTDAIARKGKIFSYADKHWIATDDVLIDVSFVVDQSKQYTDDKTVEAKEYTDNRLNHKIQYLQNQAAYDAITSVEGVLYLIGDE